jgi:hypothetical protein
MSLKRDEPIWVVATDEVVLTWVITCIGSHHQPPDVGCDR